MTSTIQSAMSTHVHAADVRNAFASKWLDERSVVCILEVDLPSPRLKEHTSKSPDVGSHAALPRPATAVAKMI